MGTRKVKTKAQQSKLIEARIDRLQKQINPLEEAADSVYFARKGDFADALQVEKYELRLVRKVTGVDDRPVLTAIKQANEAYEAWYRQARGALAALRKEVKALEEQQAALYREWEALWKPEKAKAKTGGRR